MKKRLLATIPVLLVVFLCSYGVYADSTPTHYFQAYSYLYPSGASSTATSDLYSRIEITSFNGEQSTYVQMIGSSSSGAVYTSYDRWTYKVLVKFSIYNTTSQDARIPGTFVDYMIKPQNSVDLISLEPIQSLGIVPVHCNISGNVTFNTDSSIYSGNIIVPANNYVTAIFELTYAGYEVANQGSAEIINFTTANCHWVNPTIPISATFGDFNQYEWQQFNDIYDELVNIYNKDSQIYTNIVNILSSINTGNSTNHQDLENVLSQLDTMQDTQLLTNSYVYQILQAYAQNISGSEAVTQDSGSLTTQSDTIHNQESQYYTQTNTALSNTGLSNYSFSPNVIGGLGIVKDQFTYVWNKLGNYNVVFTFSLTLGIALLIIRHVRPVRRKKEE